MYLDNAATTFPKPASVLEAISEHLEKNGSNPGRSGHSASIMAAREIFETRELIAGFFNSGNSDKVIFTYNATYAINVAVKGILTHGDHVVISHLEHNSVNRPVLHMMRSGVIDLSVAACDANGLTDLNHLVTLLRPNTRMVIINHGSNVCGAVQPVGEIGKICHDRGIVFLVDAAQTAGFIDIDMQKDNIDILIFSGHKKLYGVQGVGGMAINAEVSINPLLQGGTGSRSESDIHPGFYPDRLEAGTPNTPGIIALKAGLRWVMEKGTKDIRNHQLNLTRTLIEGLRQIDGVVVLNPEISENRLPVVSITVKDQSPSEIAMKLDKEYGILTRPGLQCSPLAHKAMGTFPEGTVRFSSGAFNTEDEIRTVIDIMKKLALPD